VHASVYVCVCVGVCVQTQYSAPPCPPTIPADAFVYTLIHMCTHTHTYTYIHAHTCTYSLSRDRSHFLCRTLSISLFYDTLAPTLCHSLACVRFMRARPHTHTHLYTHTHTHKHTHQTHTHQTHAHTRLLGIHGHVWGRKDSSRHKTNSIEIDFDRTNSIEMDPDLCVHFDLCLHFDWCLWLMWCRWSWRGVCFRWKM